MYCPPPNLPLRARTLIFTLVFLVAVAASPFQTIAQSATPAQPPKLPDLIGTRDSSFDIPFSIGKAQGSVVQVVLHASYDFGKTWQQVATRPPAEKSFPFKGTGEGQYWFAIQTIGRDGTRAPPNDQLKPELRIAIDRKDPELEFTVRPDAAGRVVSSIIANDVNVDPDTLVIEYQPANNPAAAWTRVPAKSNRTQNSGRYHDELAWWPEGNFPELVIRASISDVAGNSVSATRQMSMPLATGQPTLRPGQPVVGNTPGVQTPSLANTGDSRILTHYQQTRMPVALEQSYGIETTNPVTERQASAPEIDTQGNGAKTPSSDSQSSPPHKVSSIPQPPLAPHRFAENTPPGEASPAEIAEATARTTNQWKSRTSSPANGVQQSVQSTTQTLPGAEASPAVDSSHVASSTSSVPNKDGPLPVTPVATTAQLPTSTVWPAQQTTPQDIVRNEPQQNAPVTSNQRNAVWSSSTTGLRDELPPPQPSSVMSSGPRFDELKNMARHANSKHFQMEYEIDAVGPEGVKAVELWATSDGANSWQRLTNDEDLRSPVDVKVENEGVYGFRIRIVSNDGLSSRQPRANDPADVWVNVDTTLPQAEITAAPYGNARDAGKLMIQWRANDSNLTLRPIRLQFSPQPQGPWTTIEDGVRNEGEYAWKPSVETPDQVFLRLEVRDEAGNIGVHMPNHPIDISGLIPRGHIRGITPIAPPASTSANQGT